MIKQIQQIVQNLLEAKKLTDDATGEIESISPLRVKIDSRFIIDESFITLLSYIDRNTLNAGDKLLLLRVRNGQHFIVLDKLK